MKPAVIKFELSGLFYRNVSGGIIGRTYSYVQIRQDYPPDMWAYSSRAGQITLTEILPETKVKQSVLF